MDSNIKLSPPWITFVNELKALFDDDSEVKVVYDENTYEVKFYVESHRKADALTKLLPTEKTFGNVTLKITVIPADKEQTIIDVFEDAFDGNPVVDFTFSTDTPFGVVNYIVFKNKVVQFFNDQMDDLNGLKSTLYQNIAQDVFGTDNKVFFCTAPMAKSLEKPLGEWP